MRFYEELWITLAEQIIHVIRHTYEIRNEAMSNPVFHRNEKTSDRYWIARRRCTETSLLPMTAYLPLIDVSEKVD